MVNLVEDIDGPNDVDYRSAEPGRRPDVEALAGRRLRQFRIASSMSQAEVASLMAAAGYSWRQTTVAKIEAAQRPLRFGEAYDLANLLGAELTDLVVSDEYEFLAPDAVEAELERLREDRRITGLRLEMLRNEQAELNGRTESAEDHMRWLGMEIEHLERRQAYLQEHPPKREADQ